MGDAAGVDPLLGEGISFALAYGELAALELARAFESADFSYSGYREQILTSPLGRCLRGRTRLARVLYGVQSQSLQRLMWWGLGFFDGATVKPSW